MIEVLFGESEAGTMREIKRRGQSGGRAEVICLGFMLDIGDIRESADSQYRKDLIYSMYMQDQWGSDEKLSRECQKPGDIYSNELKRLCEFLEKGEPVRIWYSNAPYSVCGFCHLCSILQNYENEIFAVKLPEYEVRQDHTIVSSSHWGEAAPEVFIRCLSYEKRLSKLELKMYAWNWAELQEDNSPLRAVINGKVLGVPEDFYDFLIWKRITEKPEKEARLIGDIMGNNPIGIGDWWYARRIDWMIGQGKIKIVEDSEKKYERMICPAREEYTD
ncbi:MAG TPA: DUF1835 domain-containing protein [Candidatus Mediterraneibacter faecavium]|uniref:DUF1835 domain-containing protein n=1 Tax=Candidatus Mediterraneibacter faecavium TaxID=2838668 RepID=A0A9D2Q815_9FIRM|nr:DUF1835 domain-containing protein [Candidatus Mediterraneibacter faecavium]